MTRSRILTAQGNKYVEDDGPLTSYPWRPVNPMWANYPALQIMHDPGMVHRYMNDFYTYTAAEWTVSTTEAGGSSATEALTAGAGGLLLLSNDTNDNDSDELYLTTENFYLAMGQPLWFEARFAVNEATESDFIVGLFQDQDGADPIGAAVQDGIYFLKDDGDADIDYHCEINQTDTSDDTGVDVVADTFFTYGLYWDGHSRVNYWIDRIKRASAITNVPNDTELTLLFGIQNGTTASTTMTMDYLCCAQLIQR